MAKIKVNSPYDWKDVYSDAKIISERGKKTKVQIAYIRNGKLTYHDLADFHISTLKAMVRRYNVANPYNIVNIDKVQKKEIIPTLTRLIVGDSDTYNSYIKRIESATGEKYESLSARDLERANHLFEILRRHPEDPLSSEDWSSEGIIKEVWRLATSKVKFESLESQMLDWLVAHGADSDYARYSDDLADEILTSMQEQFDSSDSDYDILSNFGGNTIFS